MQNAGTYGKRISYWDNIKGILILLVVFGHMLYDVYGGLPLINTVKVIYCFHMPAFAFVSGYFGRKESSCGFKQIIKLVFLYFVFNSIMGFLYGFSSLIEPNYSYWYLLALIAWRIITPHIKKQKLLVPILILLSIAVGFSPSVDNTFAVSRIIGFYPFYAAGCSLPDTTGENLGDKRLLKGIAFALAAAVIIYVMINYMYCGYDDLKMSAYTGALAPIKRIMLFAEAFAAIWALRYITPAKKLPFITMIGRNSLSIFVLHRPVTLFINSRFTDMPYGEVFAAAFVSAVVICLAFGNDRVGGLVERFAATSERLFEDERGKMNPARLTVLLVALGFVINAVYPHT